MDQSYTAIPTAPGLLNYRSRPFTTAIRAACSFPGGKWLVSKMLSNVVVAEPFPDAHAQILQENQANLAGTVSPRAVTACFDPASILDDSGHLLAMSSPFPKVCCRLFLNVQNARAMVH